VPNCHWHDGSLFDLEQIGVAARDAGAALVVDGAQSIGALPFDVRKVKPSFLLATAYKWLLGPYGMTFIYVSPEYQAGRPLENHTYNRAGAANIPSSITYVEEFEDGARRYDVGHRSNFIQLPMMKVALEQIIAWGADNIASKIGPVVRRIAAKGQTLGLSVPARHAGHMIGLRFPNGVPVGLDESLRREKIYVSIRANSLRVSPYIYNTGHDVDRLFDVVDELIARPA
jgi:selenocysteine lyase/cysteine desulfurase